MSLDCIKILNRLDFKSQADFLNKMQETHDEQFKGREDKGTWKSVKEICIGTYEAYNNLTDISRPVAFLRVLAYITVANYRIYCNIDNIVKQLDQHNAIVDSDNIKNVLFELVFNKTNEFVKNQTE